MNRYELSFRHESCVRHRAPNFLPLVLHNSAIPMLIWITSNTMGTKYKWGKNHAPIVAWIVRSPWSFRKCVPQFYGSEKSPIVPVAQQFWHGYQAVWVLLYYNVCLWMFINRLSGSDPTILQCKPFYLVWGYWVYHQAQCSLSEHHPTLDLFPHNLYSKYCYNLKIHTPKHYCNITQH
jgi:hypothetical protein